MKKIWTAIVVLAILLGVAYFFKDDIKDLMSQPSLIETGTIFSGNGELELGDNTVLHTGDSDIDFTGVVVESGVELITGSADIESVELSSGNTVEDSEDMEVAVELQGTVKELIEERKATLGDSDSLTEEDIQLIEDILDELIKSVE